MSSYSDRKQNLQTHRGVSFDGRRRPNLNRNRPTNMKTKLEKKKIPSDREHFEDAASIQNPQEYLADLEEKVTMIYPKRLECLLSLREAIRNPDVCECFDQEDFGWVDQNIQKLSKELDCYRKEWRHKNHLYNETLMEMENMLKTRERILNEENDTTQLFSHQPNLVHHFAMKHAELVSEMKKLKEQMYESWYTQQ